MKSRLAFHYTAVAPREPDATRAQLVERARALLSETVQAYTASLGAQSSKARMAGKRLAALQQAMAQREACAGDPGCLRAWHAQRKRQLFADF